VCRRCVGRKGEGRKGGKGKEQTHAGGQQAERRQVEGEGERWQEAESQMPTNRRGAARELCRRKAGAERRKKESREKREAESPEQGQAKRKQVERRKGEKRNRTVQGNFAAEKPELGRLDGPD
jgi:hypothetical protein